MILLRNPRKFAYTDFQIIPDVENFWKFKQEFLVIFDEELKLWL